MHTRDYALQVYCISVILDIICSSQVGLIFRIYPILVVQCMNSIISSAISERLLLCYLMIIGLGTQQCLEGYY